jgi:hypothetical protein
LSAREALRRSPCGLNAHSCDWLIMRSVLPPELTRRDDCAGERTLQVRRRRRRTRGRASPYWPRKAVCRTGDRASSSSARGRQDGSSGGGRGPRAPGDPSMTNG